MKKDKLNTNSSVDKKERREHLLCPICRPNRGENAKRRPKHGRTKPKYKEKKMKLIPFNQKIFLLDGGEIDCFDLFTNPENGHLVWLDHKTNCVAEFTIQASIIYDPFEGIEPLGFIFPEEDPSLFCN